MLTCKHHIFSTKMYVLIKLCDKWLHTYYTQGLRVPWKLQMFIKQADQLTHLTLFRRHYTDDPSKTDWFHHELTIWIKTIMKNRKKHTTLKAVLESRASRQQLRCVFFISTHIELTKGVQAHQRSIGCTHPPLLSINLFRKEQTNVTSAESQNQSLRTRKRFEFPPLVIYCFFIWTYVYWLCLKFQINSNYYFKMAHLQSPI